MAAEPAAARLTEAHRVAQNQLGAHTVAQVLATWALLDPDDLDGTFATWAAVVLPLLGQLRRTSAQLAANYLTAFRAIELGPGSTPSPLVVAGDVNRQAAITSLLVTGPVAVKAALARGVPLERAADAARARAAAASMRHVLGGGRDTITESVAADDRAQGWARAASGSACHFCAMLASRGPVYKSQGAAAGGRQDPEGRHRVHDGCNCAFEPVYRSDAPWPAGSERYADLWRQAKASSGGGDVANEFRRLITA